MPRKGHDQLPFEFGEQEEELSKTRVVTTEGGDIKITKEPTRTVWEGLAPRDENNPEPVVQPKSRKPINEKKEKRREEIKKITAKIKEVKKKISGLGSEE